LLLDHGTVGGNQGHLLHASREFEQFYNRHGPHHGTATLDLLEPAVHSGDLTPARAPSPARPLISPRNNAVLLIPGPIERLRGSLPTRTLAGMKPIQGNPVQRFLCRINVWHAWQGRHSIEGGGKWEECARCGKYRDTRPATPGMT
jgi:hypothetical protein